ncbi:ORF8 [Lymantria xylina nucleopolyhedrovirus]|uniref:ORF8 n=1 Tax=Lymantria xylina multiple nucleopolyhedrovirus TaxID=2847840 RepID=D4N245_9ABAC|nr:ORF8 [Lymantria xylina nucleopolyhedrovirus]ADD73717.1 ORF8 [Lymantria xylina nucleopolyhedrovirus]
MSQKFNPYSVSAASSRNGSCLIASECSFVGYNLRPRQRATPLPDRPQQEAAPLLEEPRQLNTPLPEEPRQLNTPLPERRKSSNLRCLVTPERSCSGPRSPSWPRSPSEPANRSLSRTRSLSRNFSKSRSTSVQRTLEDRSPSPAKRCNTELDSQISLLKMNLLKLSLFNDKLEELNDFVNTETEKIRHNEGTCEELEKLRRYFKNYYTFEFPNLIAFKQDDRITELANWCQYICSKCEALENDPIFTYSVFRVMFIDIFITTVNVYVQKLKYVR